MSNYQNVNVSSRMIRTIIWAVAGVVLVIVAMAFVMPWYNVWSQEMEGLSFQAKKPVNPHYSKSFPKSAEARRAGQEEELSSRLPL